MTLHGPPAPEVLKSLRTSETGLTYSEAARRRIEHGANAVEEAKGEPLALRLFHAFGNFFAIILWVAAALAFFAERAQPGQGMATLGAAILGVILVNGAFSFWQEAKAEHALRELSRLLPRSVKVVRGGQEQSLPAEELVPGDVILVAEGDDVPADARLVEAHHMRVVEAAMTGETAPRDRDANESAAVDPAQATNMIFAGTQVVSGRGRAVVVAIGMRTELGKIATLTQGAGQPLSPLQREIVRLSRTLAIVATALGVGFFVIGRALKIPFWDSFLFGIGILVANVPEGLLPTVTLALAMASQRMAKRNVLIRHLPSVEALGSATVICTDKTGTLTQNKMELVSAYVAGRRVDVANFTAASLGDSLLRGALACHSLGEVKDGTGKHLTGDPMEIALVTVARGLTKAAVPERLDEVPFDPDRKRLTVLVGRVGGAEIHTKGAVETVLPLCAAIEEASGVRAITMADCERVVAAQDAMARRGLRVLAFARRDVEGDAAGGLESLEHGLTLSGLVGLYDPPRPEVPDAVRRCRLAGIRTIMVTGDHPTTAVAIGREIKLITTEDPVIVTGPELAKLGDPELGLLLDAEEILFARTKPEQKMRIVEALQRKKHVVAVTGDGVNDAPALKRADIGIAMGKSGTDVARGAADIVLADDNFASIVAGIEEGRAVFANIRKFLTYILTSNVPELVPYLAFVLLKIPLPLTVVQILAVDLGTDMLPALALGMEPPDPTIMDRPPRRRDERLLDGRTLVRAYLFLGFFESVAALAGFFFVLWASGWKYGETTVATPLYREATAATFAGIVMAQVANVFLCRSETVSAFAVPLLRNRWLWAGLLTELSLLAFIVFTPWGQALFGTAPVRPGAWLFILPFVVGMFGAEELRKLVARRRGRAR